MSSRVAIRVLGAGLGVLVLVGSARAGIAFPECNTPQAVPDDVLAGILSNGSFDFGNLSAKTCNSIVNKGVSVCKAQVKLAANCNEKALAGTVDIVLKQCDQLANSMDRSDCKAGTKSEQSSIKDSIKASQSLGLTECEGTFELSLSDACTNGVAM
jgi:hypothetical protein